MIINFVDIIQICHKKENTAKTSKQNCGEEYEIKHRTVTARAFQRGGGGAKEKFAKLKKIIWNVFDMKNGMRKNF